MAVEKPSIPKGTRDFLPVETARRKYIFNTIRDVYSLYGFQEIETPAMEKLSTLLGKYGEEGDKLLFRILNSGNFLKNTSVKELNEKDLSVLSKKISGKGLRYDLTVPFARYVVQNQNEITFPFKRYQIQPVWRADRPQKSRYREFYQCDADIIGSDSILNEIELIQIIDEVFSRLEINVIIKINNRKILSGIAEIINVPEKITDITIAVDKLEKVGIKAVNNELKERGLSVQEIERLQPFIQLKGDNQKKLMGLKYTLALSQTGITGISELEQIIQSLDDLDLKNTIEIDTSLARGLNYYTGVIIEVKALDFEIGSLCGGGRYDELTRLFGLDGISGVGISFGAERIYDVLERMDKFPEEISPSSTILFVNFGAKEEKYCLELASKLRKMNISCEIYPEVSKMKKQMTYADKINIPYVVLAGENEIKNKTITVKNMKSGEQKELSINKLDMILNTV
ncbi:histidine--tRNA ligase [Bacteroidota bacterium]